MIKEAIQYIVNLGNKEVVEVGAQKYAFGQQDRLELIKEATADALVVHNLSGLVDYLKSNYDNQPPVLIQVESPTTVNVYSTFNRDKQRDHLIQASALLPNINFGRYDDVENFNVMLQACFVPNDHRATLLQVVGNVKEEDVKTVGDTGTAQQVTVKKGVATVEGVVVPNPVMLKPYRTFVEITQPESRFVFRMKSGPLTSLFEADGGAWKVEAVHSIRDYLTDALNELIAEKKVTIIA